MHGHRCLGHFRGGRERRDLRGGDSMNTMRLADVVRMAAVLIVLYGVSLHEAAAEVIEGNCPLPEQPPCGGEAVTVAKRGSAVLPPGTYGPVVVKQGGTLTLEGGTYVF